MMHINNKFYCIFFCLLILNRTYAREKIVGLVAVHNESALIANCLCALSEYTDAIVVLDDASSDNTLFIVKSLLEQCKIEKIIEKKDWIRDEQGDKNKLLYAGRSVGGTHFIMLDADEMFVATCKKNNWLRNELLKLKVGQVMRFTMMNVWGNHLFYRDDTLCSPKSPQFAALAVAFCDDGKCDYNDNKIYGPSGTMHVTRIPYNLNCNEKNKSICFNALDNGILHFKYVNFKEIPIKKIWYMCHELVKKNELLKNELMTDSALRKKIAQSINTFYSNEFSNALVYDQNLIKVQPCPKKWYEYDFFSEQCFEKLVSSRKAEILAWIHIYGALFFKDLDIWQDPWLKEIFL